MYIYNMPDWPDFEYDLKVLQPLLGEVRHGQGMLLGQMKAAGFRQQESALVKTLTLDVTKSSEIEGEYLNSDLVRSSIARRLGIDAGGVNSTDRNIEGVVEMMLDATQQYQEPLTAERLFGWHAALFPTGYSGMFKITVGDWRKGDKGPMQVVSGPIGRETVHFEAPDAALVPGEMERFLAWFNAADSTDPVLKAAIAHIWFVTIHPFDDGNGRITRALTDMLLARADRSSQRYYSLSAQILQEKREYYTLLEQTQKGELDVTEWIRWLLGCIYHAIERTEEVLEDVRQRAGFWETHRNTPFNGRQRLMVEKLLDGFFGELTNSKWAKMAKCSGDTALRDIQDLVEKRVLEQKPGGGRSTNYALMSPTA